MATTPLNTSDAAASDGRAATDVGASEHSAPAFSPLYQQIKTLILRSLQASEWKPGDMIPSEFDLAARFKVSQGTVRKAVDELAADNLLVRRQGKGTFVATHAEEQIQYRFLKLVSEDGRRPSGVEREWLDCRRQRAPADVARALHLRASVHLLGCLINLKIHRDASERNGMA